MIFNFLKYLKPIWYFNLRPKKDFGYFPSQNQFNFSTHGIVIDNDYKTDVAKQRDLAWTGFQIGYIDLNNVEGIDVWQKTNIPIEDEYRFLNKNFHKAWVLYVLIVRLVTFKNPIIEINAFIKNRKVQRIDYSKKPFLFEEYDEFKSKLIESNPLVSVIIPTLN